MFGTWSQPTDAVLLHQILLLAVSMSGGLGHSESMTHVTRDE